MIDVDVVTESIEHLDFATPCTIRLGYVLVDPATRRETRPRVEIPCERPAAWAMRCVVCGTAATVCDEHRVRIVSLPRATCGCGTTGIPLQMFSFFPLAVS